MRWRRSTWQPLSKQNGMGALIAGIVIWAPQDMLISLRADCWTHVWVDSFAVVTMLPPLAGLWLIDRPSAPSIHDPKITTCEAS